MPPYSANKLYEACCTFGSTMCDLRKVVVAVQRHFFGASGRASRPAVPPARRNASVARLPPGVSLTYAEARGAVVRCRPQEWGEEAVLLSSLVSSFLGQQALMKSGGAMHYS